MINHDTVFGFYSENPIENLKVMAKNDAIHECKSENSAAKKQHKRILHVYCFYILYTYAEAVWLPQALKATTFRGLKLAHAPYTYFFDIYAYMYYDDIF